MSFIENEVYNYGFDFGDEKVKTIAVLLDLDGTSDFINDEKAKMFIHKLEFIRQKFGADVGTISISTHFSDSSKMYDTLEVLSRNLNENIRIGLNFYYSGIYDFYKKAEIHQLSGFNRSKVDTFDEFYVHNSEFENMWFSLIDDGLSDDIYKNYQNVHPMFLCRPSQRENKIKYNCFMNISTVTKGFDGVLECFDKYIESIKELSLDGILEKQKDMLVHLPSYDLNDKTWNRDYQFLTRYFSEGFADESDYVDTLSWLILTNNIQKPTEEEQKQIEKLLDMMVEKFSSNNDEENIERVQTLVKIFGKK